MKAITILQPWASLIACGAKKIETRSWATKYRGPLAIHAGKDRDKKGERIRHIVARAEQYGIVIPEMTFGAVIAIAELVDCVVMQDIWIGKDDNGKAVQKVRLENGAIVTGNEIVFGDYTPGRYAWILANVRTIKPVPAKGKQRLWEWDEK